MHRLQHSSCFIRCTPAKCCRALCADFCFKMPKSLTYEQGAMVEPLSNAGKALPAAVLLVLPVLEGWQVQLEACLTLHVSMQAVQHSQLGKVCRPASLECLVGSAFYTLLIQTLGRGTTYQLATCLLFPQVILTHAACSACCAESWCGAWKESCSPGLRSCR